jgi:hypothetical protein
MSEPTNPRPLFFGRCADEAYCPVILLGEGGIVTGTVDLQPSLDQAIADNVRLQAALEHASAGAASYRAQLESLLQTPALPTAHSAARITLEESDAGAAVLKELRELRERVEFQEQEIFSLQRRLS